MESEQHKCNRELYDIEEDKIKELMQNKEFFQEIINKTDSTEIEYMANNSHTLKCDMNNNVECNCREEKNKAAIEGIRNIISVIGDGIKKAIEEREKKFENEFKKNEKQFRDRILGDTENVENGCDSLTETQKRDLKRENRRKWKYLRSKDINLVKREPKAGRWKKLRKE